VIISEFGGISFVVDDDHAEQPAREGAFRDAGWSGYGGVRSSEQLLAGYGELVTALLDSPAVVGFCWTQLTDTQQERNGLVTVGRRPKADIDRIREITTRVSAAVPGDAVGEFAYGDYAPGAAAE
jgi:hypothetical protein